MTKRHQSKTTQRRSFLDRHLISPALISLSVMFSGISWSQQHEDTLGKHIVRPGDTLSGITELYLKDDFLWRENWRLNPHIENPDLLSIGQELTVIKERKIQAKAALLSTLSNQVDKNLQNSSWSPAIAGDQLIERDGVRTLRNASALLVFNDQSSLKLSEYSQIFLETKTTDLRGHDRGKVTVRKGSAELVFEPITGRKKTEIELIAGSAVTRPEQGSAGQTRLVAAKSEESDSAAVMVYEGRSSVEAAGQSVALTPGTGTTVPANGPPSPPEKLLAAPKGLSLKDESQWKVTNQWLKWQPVSKAKSYKVEICTDSECNQLVMIGSSLTDTRWQPELPGKGRYYGRVSAISESGLQGYPSKPAGFEVLSDDPDLSAPSVAWMPSGFTKSLDDGKLLISQQTQLMPVAHDGGIGVSRIEINPDNQGWRTWQGNPIIAANYDELAVRAIDGLDQISETATLTMRVAEE